MNARELFGGITPVRCVEWFIVGNVAFLGVDIALAHAHNAFARRVEWAPVAFSVLATALLMPMTLGIPGNRWRAVERAVGVGTVLIGVLGVVFHLESGFFQERTLHRLVYSAPFVAPLAYVGVGLLLLLVRSERVEATEVAWWLRLLALGGFAGNLALSLLDHAQNGFFHFTEWIPVVSAAFATSFLLVAWARPDAAIVLATWIVLAVALVVGLLGFAFHVAADMRAPATRLMDRFVFGAPAFAPLLFADLAALSALALWATERAGPGSRSRSRSASASDLANR